MLTDQERDRMIEAGEELKRQRMAETHYRVVLSFVGKEWAPGRMRRSRYFIVSVPKNWGEFPDKFAQARNYIDSSVRFPQLYELTLSGHYETFSVSRVLHGDEGDCVEIT